MIDPLSLLVGGALVAAGWGIGRVSRNSVASSADPAKIVCSCGHGYGFHDRAATCRGQVERPHYLHYGPRSGYEWVPCPCLFYDGPEPLPRVWTTETP